jgi:hypothetical protein
MEQKLTKVFLHGRLGKLYGKEWNLAVRSPGEAIRAINSNVNGKLIQQLQKEGTKKFYKICLGNTENSLDKNEALSPSGNIDIHIIPVVKGKKSENPLPSGPSLCPCQQVAGRRSLGHRVPCGKPGAIHGNALHGRWGTASNPPSIIEPEMPKVVHKTWP